MDNITNEYKGTRRTQVLFLIPVVLATLFIAWLILYNAGWKLGDDHQFLRTTAVNKYIPFRISPEIGRFFPLGAGHYNILVPISYLMHWDGVPAAAHFVLNAIIYIITIISLYFLFNDIGPSDTKKYPFITTLFLCLFPLYSRAFIPIFMECIFSETIITVLLSIFMLCYYYALKTGKPTYYIISLLASVYATYCKEPIFGIFAMIAITNQFFNKKNINKYNYAFNVSLLTNGIIFIFLYYLISYRYSTALYNEGRGAQSIIELISIIVQDKIICLIAILFIIRLFFVLIKKDRDHIYYDSLLFASFGYISAYIALHMNAAYYFFPSVILSLPAFIYWIKYLIYKNKILSFSSLIISLVLLCLSNFFYENHTARSILSQRIDTNMFIKNIITDIHAGKNIIFYQSDSYDTKDVFYKAIRRWQYHTINYFINYELKNKQEIDYLKTTSEAHIVNKNDVFLYSRANNNFLPMHDDVANTIEKSNFCLNSELFNILIYDSCTSRPLERNKSYSFSEDEQFLRRGRGWSSPEPGGVWSEGAKASIHTRLPDADKKDTDMVIMSHAFLDAAKLPKQTVEVSVNGHSVGALRYTLEENNGERTLKIPASLIPDDGAITLTFLIDKPTSPHDLGLSEDTRKLGLWLTSLRFR